MHLIKCQASFKYCNDSNGFCKKFTCLYQDEVASARWKTNSGTLVTVMILFEKESISVVIVSGNKHDKRTVVP